MKVITLTLTLFLVACDHGFDSRSNDLSHDYISNGERIYLTGTSASGQPVNSLGGDAPMGMHRQMHGGGCASCHGDDRDGRRLWPRFWIEAPALTTEALFGDDDHGADSSDHGDHGSYDAVSLRRAITQGFDPAGEALDNAMPRWSMAEADINDLVSYLQQSHEH
jgi:mono/diheme cytochrome c family protein